MSAYAGPLNRVNEWGGNKARRARKMKTQSSWIESRTGNPYLVAIVRKTAAHVFRKML
jgi:hypothetical protein